MKKYALISVSDKTGIVELAQALLSANFSILATGKTANLLTENKIEVTEVSDYATFPEVFGGRVKTLQPKIFGGILFRRNNFDDLEQAKLHGIDSIDVVCVNLYPFPQVVLNKNASLEEKIENIDIGGPSLIRAASKNYKNVSVLTSAKQYQLFIDELSENGKISLKTNEILATEAFAHTAYYDKVIADYFEQTFLDEKNTFRENLSQSRTLRYGENPHQKAAVYGDFESFFEIMYGKEVSYNNIIDLVAAVELSEEIGEKSVSIIKHTNPSGAAKKENELESYLAALSGDPISAFGGIVSINGKVDEILAEKLNEIFNEIVVAKDFTDTALEILKKKKMRRIIKISKPLNTKQIVKSIPGGYLVQDYDNSQILPENFQLVSSTKSENLSFEDLRFSWIIGKHVKSNAIAITKDMKILGVGAGQMSRVDSAKIAVSKAIEHGHDLSNAIASSDAFFPFADGLEILINNGIKTVIEPGGSKNDEEVIESANKNSIDLYFTRIRNFKH